jgi:F-type H+-transporting ATPase subunit delta
LRDAGIARNYAEALFEVGERTGESERYGAVLDALAGAVAADEHIRVTLESPRTPKGQKVLLLRRALEGRSPVPFQRWMEAVARRGRLGLLDVISREYLGLLDVKFNRVHAGVVLARRADPSLQAEITRRLSAALGKDVIPHFREDANLLGGLVVRIGDRVIDGSIRHKLHQLRRQMLGG